MSQAIIEHAHGTLKHVLQKQKAGMIEEPLHSRLQKALYTIIHLTVPSDSDISNFFKHFLSLRLDRPVTFP